MSNQAENCIFDVFPKIIRLSRIRSHYYGWLYGALACTVLGIVLRSFAEVPEYDRITHLTAAIWLSIFPCFCGGVLLESKIYKLLREHGADRMEAFIVCTGAKRLVAWKLTEHSSPVEERTSVAEARAIISCCKLIGVDIKLRNL